MKTLFGNIRHYFYSLEKGPLYEGICEGFLPFLLPLLAENNTDQLVIYVSSQENSLEKIRSSLQKLNPNLTVMIFPAWDCLPYDRISPHLNLSQQRLKVLSLLKRHALLRQKLPRKTVSFPPSPLLILTTIQALHQRLQPPESIQEIFLSLSQAYPREIFLSTLTEQGFYRSDVVKDKGEFAVRGSIIDIFPPDSAYPIRLDWFGDSLESIKIFDPQTQRTKDHLSSFCLFPLQEITLTPSVISCFRQQYRSLSLEEDIDYNNPFYEAVSQNRRYSGMEQWLPLFYPHATTFLDYCPQATLIFDHSWRKGLQQHWEEINHYYEACSPVWRAQQLVPLTPEKLYLPPTEVESSLHSYSLIETNERNTKDTTSFQTFTLPLYQKKRIGNSIIEWIDYLKGLFPELPFVICCPKESSLEQLQKVFKHYPQYPLEILSSFNEQTVLSKQVLNAIVLDIPQGFSSPFGVFLTEQELFGYALRQSSTEKTKKNIFVVQDIQEGELVVHKDHGIGRYKGIRTVNILNHPHDCLDIEYRNGGTLLIPVENNEVLSRYGEETGELDILGSAAWQNRKARLKKRIQEIAGHLITIAAERQSQEGTTIVPLSGAYEEFCSKFPYIETADQFNAIDDVITDLASGKPMDRLICGDVGFGKTEVAMRAAFIVASQGLQVAVIVPTTLLCRQHYENFLNRFQGTDLVIRQLSRLVPAAEMKKTHQQMKEGTVHIVVATHGILNPKVSWQHLGLMIIDEEHHFGVIQKETLKKIKATVHVLTLTATPIPRTLQLSLTGIRDLSLITTPPQDRLAVRTVVFSYDPSLIQEAIEKEYNRGGQIFYVCPHIEDLDKIALKVQALFPKLRLIKAHGQLPPAVLEQIMVEFYDHQYDLLLSTPIIESGIDLPTVNTIIIHRAERFGLAQLYQLRGRVGRGKIKGYAYLSTSHNTLLTENAKKRLEVIEKLDYLGAGFTLASHDMEIRGTGNIIGQEQSGHIKEVGIELYHQMLQDALEDQQKKSDTSSISHNSSFTVSLNLGLPVAIPESYIPEIGLRLQLYRQAALCSTEEQIRNFSADLLDRFGPFPPETQNFLTLIHFKMLCRHTGIEKLDTGPNGMVIRFYNNIFQNPAALLQHISTHPLEFKIRPDQRLVIQTSMDKQPLEKIEKVLHLLLGFLKDTSLS